MNSKHMNLIPPDFFERMPTEVRELWLDPIAAMVGWPFQTLDDPTENTRWYRIFMLLSLQEINELRWSLETVNIASQPFGIGNREMLGDLIQQHVMGRPPVWLRLIRSKERFWSCVDFFRANGRLPKPVILYDVRGEMDIIDGHHRLAAVTFLARINNSAPNLKVQAWVARNTK